MGITQILLLLLIGLVAGIVSGTMGVGGAIIIVPALVLVMGMGQHEAQGTSLFILTPPVVLLAMLAYAKQGFVNYRFGLIVMVAFFIGGLLGAKLAISLPEQLLKKLFGILIILVGLRLILGK